MAELRQAGNFQTYDLYKFGAQHGKSYDAAGAFRHNAWSQVVSKLDRVRFGDCFPVPTTADTLRDPRVICSMGLIPGN